MREPILATGNCVSWTPASRLCSLARGIQTKMMYLRVFSALFSMYWKEISLG